MAHRVCLLFSCLAHSTWPQLSLKVSHLSSSSPLPLPDCIMSPSLQLVHVLSGMLVSATGWQAEDHMMLLRCVRDSIDLGVLGSLTDHLNVSTLPLPMGQPLHRYTLH